MVTQFCDQPDSLRLAIRSLVEDAGGTIEGYYGPGVQVILAADADARRRLIEQCEQHGGTVRKGSRFRFAACNGEPDHQLCWQRESERGNRGSAHVEYVTLEWEGGQR